jgi:hypothetical protein
MLQINCSTSIVHEKKQEKIAASKNLGIKLMVGLVYGV